MDRVLYQRPMGLPECTSSKRVSAPWHLAVVLLHRYHLLCCLHNWNSNLLLSTFSPPQRLQQDSLARVHGARLHWPSSFHRRINRFPRGLDLSGKIILLRSTCRLHCHYWRSRFYRLLPLRLHYSEKPYLPFPSLRHVP